MMFHVMRSWYKYGREGDEVMITDKYYDTIEKALAYAERYAKGIRFVMVQIETDDDNMELIYEYLADGGRITVDKTAKYKFQETEHDEELQEMIVAERKEETTEQRSEEEAVLSMNRVELCKQLKEGTFYFYKFGLLIKLPVVEVIDKEDFITLRFANNGGYVNVFVDYMQKVISPGNILSKFDWCYSLKNEYGNLIGYIGKEEKEGVPFLYKAMDKAIDEVMKEKI